MNEVNILLFLETIKYDKNSDLGMLDRKEVVGRINNIFETFQGDADNKIKAKSIYEFFPLAIDYIMLELSRLSRDQKLAKRKTGNLKKRLFDFDIWNDLRHIKAREISELYIIFRFFSSLDHWEGFIRQTSRRYPQLQTQVNEFYTEVKALQLDLEKVKAEVLQEEEILREDLRVQQDTKPQRAVISLENQEQTQITHADKWSRRRFLRWSAVAAGTGAAAAGAGIFGGLFSRKPDQKKQIVQHQPKDQSVQKKPSPEPPKVKPTPTPIPDINLPSKFGDFVTIFVELKKWAPRQFPKYSDINWLGATVFAENRDLSLNAVSKIRFKSNSKSRDKKIGRGIGQFIYSTWILIIKDLGSTTLSQLGFELKDLIKEDGWRTFTVINDDEEPDLKKKKLILNLLAVAKLQQRNEAYILVKAKNKPDDILWIQLATTLSHNTGPHTQVKYWNKGKVLRVKWYDKPRNVYAGESGPFFDGLMAALNLGEGKVRFIKETYLGIIVRPKQEYYVMDGRITLWSIINKYEKKYCGYHKITTKKLLEYNGLANARKIPLNFRIRMPLYT